MKKLTRDDVHVEVTTEVEDESPRGAFGYDSEEENRITEDEIIDRLNRGQDEAWCCLVVRVFPKDERINTYHGTATLGCCNFAHGSGSFVAKQAHEMAEEHGMVEEALDELNECLAATVRKAKQIVGILS